LLGTVPWLSPAACFVGEKVSLNSEKESSGIHN
jgi:hypothetical protein